MTITVSQPVITKPVSFGDPNMPMLVGGPTPMLVCKIPVSFNGSTTEAVAHCVSVDDVAVEDDAPLKWANFPGYQRPLVGGMTTMLGLFEIHEDGIYLHSVSDTFPKKPVITAPGGHSLKFRIDSPDHCMTFSVVFTFAEHSASLGA